VGLPLQTFQIAPGISYSPHPHHRNGNQNKSQWTIDQPAEVLVFTACYQQQWVAGSVGWGLHIVGGAIHYLGIDQNHSEQVFIAKFVSGQAPHPWHGYPADHRNNQADIPHEDILKMWMQGNVLPACKISKILGGKKCRL
jgi:hypothetical protein